MHSRLLGVECSMYLFLFLTIYTHEISSGKEFWHARRKCRTNEIPTWKILDSRNTDEKKFWTREILTRKNFGHMKYPQRHNRAKPTRPKMARDPRNLAYCFYRRKSENNLFQSYHLSLFICTVLKICLAQPLWPNKIVKVQWKITMLSVTIFNFTTNSLCMNTSDSVTIILWSVVIYSYTL